MNPFIQYINTLNGQIKIPCMVVLNILNGHIGMMYCIFLYYCLNFLIEIANALTL
jgi:hypothetical protein